MLRSIAIAQANSETAVSGGILQRKCACGQHANGGECEGCREKKESLQRKQANRAELAGVPPIVHNVLSAPGRPLDQVARRIMEPRFEQDFSQVRVHTDSRASESARSVNALAYTAGRNIIFDTGRYAPETEPGKRLLAHELSHVVQQGARKAPGKLSLGPKDTPAEQEADAIAQAVISGTTLPAIGSVRNGPVQRFSGIFEDPSNFFSLEDMEPESEKDGGDPGEVHDGDSPVSAGGGGGALSAGLGTDDLLAFADDGKQAEHDRPSGDSKPAESSPQDKDTTAEKKDPKPAKPAPRKIMHILVDQASQTMTLTWSDGKKDKPVDVSTGKGRPNTQEDPCKNQTEENCTPNGVFKVGSLGDGNTKNQHNDAMSWYVEFVRKRGIGIHNSQTVISGTPLSHGCVRVGKGKAADALAKLINKNVIPDTTEIEVQGKAPTKPWKKAAPQQKKKNALLKKSSPPKEKK